ncbi:hypothetical protein SAMN02800694_2624 [Luteibacter sp. UNCMF331Sha3.1]|uniref:hypothetical protein n=1 Tax=Luteibacter sp. UNCMF331Sha3.1 TaxID=1502760 RepID=UPI0008D31B5A|nr:hypothetical protein [Luteibacter sp. UNCMF331Sha3.1]SEN05452.1 hypothetical protein SAMN02800694_2624 [Luteibacter sp. UNCMF331Sha3.1]
MIKLDGFDKLTRELRQFEAAMASLDGELATVKLDPEDPGSIERAIMEVESLINSKLADYPGNAMIANMGDQIKDNLRQQIVEKAAQLRAANNGDA